VTAEGARSGQGGPFRFPRTARITASEEIRALFRRGKRKRTRHLDVFVSVSPVSRSRLGLVVPKHRQTIVLRNRLKRRLREIGRTELLPRLRKCAVDYDVLIRARPEAYGAQFEEIREELVRAVEEVCSSGR
jgi:ribonuclease P protein component